MENGIKVNLPNMGNAIKRMNSASNPAVQKIGNAKTESVDIATFTPKEASVSGGSAIQYKVPDSESSKKAENFWNTTFLPWANEVGSATLQAIKKTGATVGIVRISLVEGVGKFGESLVDAGAILGTGVNSITTGIADGIQAINGLITGEEWTSMTKSMWNDTMDFVKTDHVGDTFDKFYQNTKVGQALKENAVGFDITRGLGNAVGEIGGLIALTIFTAGIGTAATGASAAASGASTATTAASSAATAASSMSKVMAGINAASGLGRGASKAWNEGANCVEGLGYGTLLGAWNAAQVGVGMKIQGLKWPFPKEMSGKAVTKVLNSTSHVLLDGIDNGLEAFTQPLFEKVYKEEDYQTLFEEAGGWSNFGTQFAAGSFFSAASEVGAFNKILTKNATDTTVSHSTLKIGDSSYEMSDAMYTSILDSMEKSNLAQNLDLSGGTIKIKDNLDPKVKCETLYNLLERSSAFIGQGVLDDDVLMQKWNEGVGRSLSSKGDLIKFLMENQKYDRADKVMMNLLTDLYDFRKNVTVSSPKINAQTLKTECLKDIETYSDPISKARILYERLNRKLHYDVEYLTGSQELQDQIYAQTTSFNNLKSKNVICKSWAELYKELLLSAGFSEEDIIIRGSTSQKMGTHQWIEIKYKNSVIICDSTDVINGTTDLVKSKCGGAPNGFLLLDASYAGSRPRKLFKPNEEGVVINKPALDYSANLVKNLDLELGIAGKNGYKMDQIANSKKLFQDSALVKKLFGETTAIEKLSKIPMAQNMDGLESYGYYREISGKLLGDNAQYLSNKLYYNRTENSLEPLNLITYFDGSEKEYAQVYSESLGRITFDSFDKANAFMKSLNLER